METRISPANPLPAGKLVTEIALLLQQAIVGYRFHPTEEELLNYLKWKVTGCRETLCIIPTLENIYEINPWDLPAKFIERSIIRSRDQEWWFICPQMQNQRISRKTPCGSSWKITGKHKDIKAKNDDKKIGSKITLVFLDGRNFKGTRSTWVMHEFHPHPDDTSFVLYCLKMKQDEKADNQEPSIQVMRNQPNHAAMSTNGDFSSTPQFQCPKVSFSERNEVIGELSNKVYSKSDGSYQNGTKSLALIQEDNHHSSPNQEHLMWSKNSSGTENSSGRGLAVSDPTNDELNFPHPFLDVDVCSAIEAEKEKIDQIIPTAGYVPSDEQADKSLESMDCDNPGQLPFAEHHVQEMQNQPNDLIMNGSSSSTEISSGSCSTVSDEWNWIERLMSPVDHDSFPNSDVYNFKDPISETEAGRGVIQYGQLGETSWDNLWANKNRRPVCDILEGAVPLEEEEGFVEQKLNYPQNTEKIITECTSSVGAPAKAKAAKFKEKETTMIQPQKKKDDVKMESDNISRWETWNDSLSLTRSTASTSCCCRNKSTIDPRVLLAKLITVVLVAYLIVHGICRISDGINQTIQHNVIYRRF
ncbi:NAC domain-containing protein 101-like [Syzygium oleosum]|uniref:NAC domain-containing protein 101-like n=1 Tax=Syzygium oleosum TaxID=219896 RepID=UPI0024B9FE2A|nr:NAC domain-containing protein 101-like [Syzygium oleosum]